MFPGGMTLFLAPPLREVDLSSSVCHGVKSNLPPTHGEFDDGFVGRQVRLEMTHSKAKLPPNWLPVLLTSSPRPEDPPSRLSPSLVLSWSSLQILSRELPFHPVFSRLQVLLASGRLGGGWGRQIMKHRCALSLRQSHVCECLVSSGASVLTMGCHWLPSI